MRAAAFGPSPNKCPARRTRALRVSSSREEAPHAPRSSPLAERQALLDRLHRPPPGLAEGADPAVARHRRPRRSAPPPRRALGAPRGAVGSHSFAALLRGIYPASRESLSKSGASMITGGHTRVALVRECDRR